MSASSQSSRSTGPDPPRRSTGWRSHSGRQTSRRGRGDRGSLPADVLVVAPHIGGAGTLRPHSRPPRRQCAAQPTTEQEIHTDRGRLAPGRLRLPGPEVRKGAVGTDWKYAERPNATARLCGTVRHDTKEPAMTSHVSGTRSGATARSSERTGIGSGWVVFAAVPSRRGSDFGRHGPQADDDRRCVVGVAGREEVGQRASVRASGAASPWRMRESVSPAGPVSMSSCRRSIRPSM